MELSPEGLAGFFATVLPHLDERQTRVVCGAMVSALGRGGQARVVEASALSSSTVNRGTQEVRAGFAVSDRVRAPGGGAKQAIDTQPGLLVALDELVFPETRGNPMSLLRWTLKSTYQLADTLRLAGFELSAELVRRLLHDLGYSLQAPSKQKEGASHPDRDGQFRYINDLATGFIDDDEPVVSVDTKKKELIGNYANGGREWRPAGDRLQVNGHDFPDPALGEYPKAIPYGVYDIANNEGWVSVGDTADTAEFAVESIRRWWNHMGRSRFPEATRLLITADGGGSNGSRVKAWKAQIAALAAETGLHITVCHYPPGTSKWNKIEHRMFSFITANWRSEPLTSIRTIVELISATTTKTGLSIQAAYDPNWYPTGVKISDTELAALPLDRHDWHPDWNYTLAPRTPPPPQPRD